jgi:hypothetical protein
MSVQVGPYEFGVTEYDHFGDVLYLRSREAERVEGLAITPEGHAFMAAEGGTEIVGLDMIGPREKLAREGRLVITLPGGEVVRIEGAESLVAD